MPRLAARFGGRQVVAVGFLATALGFAAVGFTDPTWKYTAFVLPLAASSASTVCVSAEQVGEASGVSKMARYVGAAVATALAATINAGVSSNQLDAGNSSSQALASGLGVAAWVMAAFSTGGVLMAVLMGRHRTATGTLEGSAAAAAAHTHTLPTFATPSGAHA